MPQVIEFPALGADVRAATATLARMCKDMPPAGDSLREFRARLRAAKLWDRERPLVMLRFLGVTGATPTITPSPFMQALAAAANDDGIAEALLERLWQLNPLLGKMVAEQVNERPFQKDELYKLLGSAAYRSAVPSRPSHEHWLQLALGAGLLKSIGIAVAAGPRIDKWKQRIADLDVDEFLAEDRAETEPVWPTSIDDDAGGGAVVASIAPSTETSIPVAATGPAALAPSGLRDVVAASWPQPRGRDRVVAAARFSSGFDDTLLDETRRKIATWWSAATAENTAPSRYSPTDFGLDAEGWVEGADEILYRIAVAAALAFRLDADRSTVIAAFGALDAAGVLSDLFHGTVPDTLSAQVDARALMLASLAARRIADAPDLASRLEQQTSAAAVFEVLELALGRGLFRVELCWILDQLGQLGVIRQPDLGDFTATPYRLVRDTLFRLGFIDTPYAADAATLVRAARATRAAVGPDGSELQIAAFAVAAGCAYDCPHRRGCDFPCRERLE